MKSVIRSLLVCFIAALACLVNNSVAISVSNTGIATITFDVQPAVTDFSSRTWAGAATDITSAAALNTAVQTNSASLFNVALSGVAANPPAAGSQGQWSSAGFFFPNLPTPRAGKNRYGPPVKKTRPPKN